MIICQNCGTTNNEAVSRTCRKCGALLPISSKSDRKKSKKKKSEKIDQELSPRERIEISIETIDEKEEKVKLQEIPKDIELNLDEIPSEDSKMGEIDSFNDGLSETEREIERDNSQALQEIPPRPFQSSLIPNRKDPISDAFSELKQSMLEEEKEELKPSLEPIPSRTDETEVSILKQKRLEKDMTEVLSFLSKKISVKKLEPHVTESKDKIEPEKKIPPANMNEILNELITLDSRIEASAIIKTDGTMLASAISSRISESLFSTIGMNLSMIGSDIIHGLSAGNLKSISVKGSEGILDLAPIDRENPNLKDMILILFSHPKVKSGIISIAINLIKKQIKYYLGLEK
ncbi:MAG: hypothetical protein ACFFAI_05665 [Promethearchaeota archaeon]